MQGFCFFLAIGTFAGIAHGLWHAAWSYRTAFVRRTSPVLGRMSLLNRRYAPLFHGNLPDGEISVSRSFVDPDAYQACGFRDILSDYLVSHPRDANNAAMAAENGTLYFQYKRRFLRIRSGIGDGIPIRRTGPISDDSYADIESELLFDMLLHPVVDMKFRCGKVLRDSSGAIVRSEERVFGLADMSDGLPGRYNQTERAWA